MKAPAPKTDNGGASGSPDAAGARKPKVATLIAENITIEGGVAGDGELHVDGVVRGDIRVAKLTIGETGHVEGTITAESVENRGRIVGAVTAKQVRLHASAYVDGDITHEQLAMEIGAFFQGRSLKFQRPAGAQQPQISAPASPSLPKPDGEPKSVA
ncbi:polymer-forming cytoskeletal protein [Phenylobacterium sp.]|jgi:cytoskeletal protein CcmA (bactofilin family)|uniref:bactofilin family protein n=1 Tax=Phenylobacterium sp. TaxID=1871053 RepID=UPI002F41FF90